MSKICLMPLDTFNVINFAYLNDSDRKLLIMLYQPIVGATGINLYYNLWTFLDKELVLSDTYNHNILLNTMGVTLSEIEQAREKLEGVGLLKTYLKEGEINNYLYELFSPLPAFDFFSNPLLCSVLHTSLGNINYKKTREYFQTPKINTSDYENITKSFNNVFASVSMRETNANEIRRKNYAFVNIKSDLDIEEILNIIPDIMLNHTKVSDDTKELILKLSFVYNFDSEITTALVRDSINDKHNIDKEKLRRNYRAYYQFENNGELPNILFKTQPENLCKPITDNSEKARTIYQFENTTPYNYVRGKTKMMKPTKYEISILEMLLVDMNMKPGVVNVLINYALKKNNNKLIKDVIEGIALQWTRSNIQTVEAAMEISKEEHDKESNNSYKKESKVIRSEKKPDWFDKNIEEKTDIVKQKELEEMLGRM